MARYFFLCMVLSLAWAPAGDSWAQNTAPVPAADAGLNAYRAKSNALTAEQRDQAQNLFERAFDLFQSEDFEAARLGFEKGLVIDPANSTANFFLAETLLRLDDKALARSLYNKVIALDPNTAIALKAEVALKTLSASGPSVAPAVGVVEQRGSARPLTVQQERALKPKDSFKECEQCPEMVVVPAGSFAMGSPQSEPERQDNEGPQHQVTFARQFAVGKFAVTFDEWDACVADGGCNGYKPSDQGWGRGRRPVINVSWNDAKTYVAWLSSKTGKTYRLLSEAEREYVTRAGTTTPFWWGSQISTSLANYDGNYSYREGPKGEYREMTMPVDSFSPNPWGLYQVHGNVLEWTKDCWNDGYRGAPTDGSARTSGDCALRVRRGGSSDNVPGGLRSASRSRFTTGARANSGFRVGRTLTP